MSDFGEYGWMSDDMDDIGDSFNNFIPEGADEFEVDPSVWNNGESSFIADAIEEFHPEDFIAGAVIGAAMNDRENNPVAGTAAAGTHGPIAGGPSIYRGKGNNFNPGKHVGAAFPSREVEGEMDIGLEVEHIQVWVDMLNSKLRELEELQAQGRTPKKWAWFAKINVKHNPRYNGKGPTHHASLVEVGAIRTEESIQRPTTSILAEAFTNPIETTAGTAPAIANLTREPQPTPAKGTVQAASELVEPPKKSERPSLWRME